ncbi:RecQ family ATP-dependent DNA helicase [Ferruginibacter sp. SUN106]|uniref:RecQ family ATP-dependent DNA helicase n=1 Tax=Ferruginibacter sp. SUN106 TaxID=2978348 RepID=UPI003D363250
MTGREILKQYWGYDAFRPLQEDIINAVLHGKDVLALLPTGGGKSICFQVPALAKDGICLVVSPLIALMKDQVENLKRKGIDALAVYSGMSFLEVKKTLQNAAYGNYKFLYVSPERLETNLFLEYLPVMNISLLAVDEAHCVSQWGYDFRPPYLRIANLRELLPNVPVLALTASATKVVQDDICEKLLFSKTQQRFQQSFERPNLSYSVFNIASKQNKLLEIVKNVPGTAIVYCKSRKQTKEIADLLRMNSINADFYHAGLNNEERNKKQESWIQNKTRVIVCTNAFGMGIDKPDVRVVVHYDVPDCLENYYQEAGRAGRDGRRAYAVLLYSNKELENLQQQSGIRFPGAEEIKNTYTALMNHLQVAAGSGEGMNYDLDLGAFTAAFKLNILNTTYAIKALEQDDVISFNEIIFKPSAALVIANRNDLTEFEKIHPELEPMIKGLLRSYEGIFDFPAIVHEIQLAKFLRKDADAVKKELKQLNDYGIIMYSPQNEKPQITLLKNRMYADSYAVNITAHLQRKKNFEQRVAAMLYYVNSTTSCRSKLIAAYFNAATTKSCGICDNCINEKALTISKEEFEQIATSVLQLIKDTPLPVKDIQQHLKNVKKEKLWKVINYLLAENKIASNKAGDVFI